MAMRWILAPMALAASAAMAQFDGPSPLAWRWSESTSVVPSGSPVVEGDSVFVAVGGRIYALDKVTGNQLWRYPVGEPLTGNFRTGVLKAGNKIIAASDQRIVYAVDAKTGQLSWQNSAGEAVVGTPVATETEVVFPLASGGLGGVTLAEGTPLWGGKGLPIKERLFPNLAVWSGGIIYTTPSGMTMVDANTGVRRWFQKFGRLSSAATPIVFGDNIYVASGSFVISLRASTGGARWQQNTGANVSFSPAVSQDGVLAMTEDEKLFVFDLNGRPATRNGYMIDAKANTSPSWAGKFALVPTSGGSVFMVDPKSGDTTWVYTIPEIARLTSSGGGGGAGGDAGIGGAAGPGGFGVPGGGAPGGGARGGGGGQPGTLVPGEGNVPAAGPGILSGSTLLLLAADGSLLAFDKTNGVDLTPPVCKMLWPSPGDLVSPNPPAELVFKLEDYTSGINPVSVKATINNAPVKVVQDKDGIVRILITQTSETKNLPIGRATIAITSTDWLGNTSTHSFVLIVDPGIDKPLGGPPRANPAGGAGGRGGGGNAGGGGGIG